MNKAYLGIDYGRKRIGLALSESGLIAKPLYTVENKGVKKNLAYLVNSIMQQNIGFVVFGLPLNANGSVGDMATEVHGFAKQLSIVAGVKIAFQDERYSSIEAEDYIRSVMGITDRKKIAQLIDSVAATMILNEYLEKGENK